MIVCVCNRLNEEQIYRAIESGASCSDEVYARCGVRKNCGRCQETIELMMDEVLLDESPPVAVAA